MPEALTFFLKSSGAGGGASLPQRDQYLGSRTTNPYGGSAGSMQTDTNSFNLIHGGNGHHGGGGGGGAPACAKTHNSDNPGQKHYNGNGGNGSRGYLIVKITGGVVTSKSWS